jgi:hypothetical protein
MLRCLALVLCLFGTSVASAANRCERLHADYKQATARIASALRSYADCIDDGNPRESCSTEFARLRAGQRLLEVSTSDFARYCRGWTDRR